MGATHFCLSALLSFTLILVSTATYAVIFLNLQQRGTVYSTNKVGAEEVPLEPKDVMDVRRLNSSTYLRS